MMASAPATPIPCPDCERPVGVHCNGTRCDWTTCTPCKTVRNSEGHSMDLRAPVRGGE